MRKKKWIIEKKFEYEDIISHLMRIRNIDAVNKEEFFHPKQSHLLDPLTMKDMDKALHRIEQALKNSENIWVYGDYDVDGISAVSILLLTFRRLGVQANYYIPKRIEEGYGINLDAIDFIKENSGDLIISVDCGITSVFEAEYARRAGVDLIITDHHQCKEDLPNAIAVIDPKQQDCQYQNQNICGAGIALKLAQAILNLFNPDFDIDELLEISAIATIADIVELSGENRTIVKLGLDSLKNAKNKGLQALIKGSGMDIHSISSSNIAFGIAPRINSSGRMGKANVGVELFLSSTEGEASSVADMLELLNKQRQAVEANIFEEALAICQSQKNQKVLVMASPNWHSGVIGIVASKITDRFHKPSLVIAIEENNKGKGSGRSIEGFNLFEALQSMDDILEKFGGHEQAAGITIDADLIPQLELRINALADEKLSSSEMIAKINIDSEIFQEDINFDILNKIEELEPFGLGNRKPLFLISDASIRNFRKIGKNANHIKCQLGKGIDMIGFNKAEETESIDISKKLDIVFELEKNVYLGKEALQLLIRDIRNSYDLKAHLIEITRAIQTFKQYYKENKELLISNQKINWNLSSISFDELDKEKKYLFLCYTPKSFRYVIKNLYYRNIDFSIKKRYDADVPNVLLMPIIDKLDVSIYNNIILCDKIFYGPFITEFSGISFQILEDSDRQDTFLPTRDMVARFFILLSKRKESVFDIDSLCNFMSMDLFGLIFSLEILADMSYVKYRFDEGLQNIKIIFTTDEENKKHDFSKTDTVLAFSYTI